MSIFLGNNNIILPNIANIWLGNNLIFEKRKFDFTGEWDYADSNKTVIRLKTSGILSFKKNCVIDAVVIGGGGGGGGCYYYGYGTASSSLAWYSPTSGGKGGTSSAFGVSATGGNGGAAGSRSTSSAFNRTYWGTGDYAYGISCPTLQGGNGAPNGGSAGSKGTYGGAGGASGTAINPLNTGIKVCAGGGGGAGMGIENTYGAGKQNNEISGYLGYGGNYNTDCERYFRPSDPVAGGHGGSEYSIEVGGNSGSLWGADPGVDNTGSGGGGDGANAWGYNNWQVTYKTLYGGSGGSGATASNVSNYNITSGTNYTITIGAGGTIGTTASYGGGGGAGASGVVFFKIKG